MRIFAVHLLNDFSGSPKVLMQLTRGWISSGIKVTIVTSGKRRGFLTDIEGASYKHYWYKWKANRLLRLISLAASQLFLFLRLVSDLREDDIVYVNTVLPFGAAIAGRIKGCKVFYHVHETSMSPALLKRFLFSIVRFAATDVVYVSRYLMKTEPMAGKRMHLLPNALERTFINRAVASEKDHHAAQKILMVCSLKPYKGIYEFISLARRCPELSFRMVVNATSKEVDKFIADIKPGANVDIFPAQSDVHPFYLWADVVLNLSRPNEWIETFGLTIIEAYAYGIPVIVPPVGGIADLVEDGVTGFHVNSSNENGLVNALELLADPAIYGKFSDNAFNRAFDFSETAMIAQSLKMLDIKTVGNPFHRMEMPG